MMEKKEWRGAVVFYVLIIALVAILSVYATDIDKMIFGSESVSFWQNFVLFFFSVVSMTLLFGLIVYLGARKKYGPGVTADIFVKELLGIFD